MKHIKSYKIFESSYEGVFTELIGKCVTDVYLNSNADTIMFFTNDGNYYTFNTYSDCCNDVWIEHLNGIDCLLNTTIFDVKDKGGDQLDPEYMSSRGGDEVEEAMLWTIFDIEVRNNHNGYYGGGISFGTSGKIGSFDMTDFKKITEDF